MKYTPFKSLPLLLSLSRLLGAFANVSVLNYAPGRTWYRAAAVGVPCTSKNCLRQGEGWGFSKGQMGQRTRSGWCLWCT